MGPGGCTRAGPGADPQRARPSTACTGCGRAGLHKQRGAKVGGQWEREIEHAKLEIYINQLRKRSPSKLVL